MPTGTNNLKGARSAVKRLERPNFSSDDDGVLATIGLFATVLVEHSNDITLIVDDR